MLIYAFEKIKLSCHAEDGSLGDGTDREVRQASNTDFRVKKEGGLGKCASSGKSKKWKD